MKGGRVGRNRAPLKEEFLLNTLGQTATLALVERLGGNRFYMPRDRFDSVAAVVGPEGAQKLAEAFGGEYILVPLARQFRARIYRAQGDSNPEIARRLGIGVRAVERMLGPMSEEQTLAIREAFTVKQRARRRAAKQAAGEQTPGEQAGGDVNEAFAEGEDE